jgi:outer membrane protein TolC
MRNLFVVGILLAASAAAQTVATPGVTSNLITSKRTPTADAPAFGTPSYFRKVFRTDERPKIELQAPVRLANFVAGDKIELSLRNYIDAVLANNTDVSIQKLSVEIPRNAIMRGYSIFDPAIIANFTSTRTESPVTNILEGVPVDAAQSQLQQPLSIRLQQMIPTGTVYNVGFTSNRFTSNSQNVLFNPALNTGLTFGVTQPLLRGRGSYLTKLPITIARSRLRAGEYQIQDQILRLVAGAENVYWDVISARENLRVQEQTLALFEQSLKRSERELELGAISELEIYQPQAEYKNAEIQVTQSRFRLQQAEDALRRQLGVDLDPQLRNLPIELTEDVAAPVSVSLDKEQLVDKAIRQRPDLLAVRQSLDVDDLNIQSAANGLKPVFNLTGQYASAGRGGILRRSGVAPVEGGLGDSLGQLFGFGFPTYGFGLQMNLPLRDRRASADYADAVVNKRLDMLRLRTQEQATRLEVLNAVSQVEQSRASIELAKVALDLAQKRADAEQKRFELGTVTMFFVLNAQTALSQATSALVNQTVNYRRNLTALGRVSGDLLTERGITIQ